MNGGFARTASNIHAYMYKLSSPTGLFAYLAEIAGTWQ